MFARASSVSGHVLHVFPGRDTAPVILHVTLDTLHADQLLNTRRVLSVAANSRTDHHTHLGQCHQHGELGMLDSILNINSTVLTNNTIIVSNLQFE